MSDAMSAIEIEDVLSSIRRLVSEDLRPAAPKPVPAETRLMLTPALRVVPQVPQDDVWEEEEDWTDLPRSAQLSPSGWSLPEAEPEPSELDAPFSVPPFSVPPFSVPVQPASARSASSEPVPDAPLAPHRFTLTQAARVLPEETPEVAPPWNQPVDVMEPPPAAPETASQPISADDRLWADQAAAEAIAGIEAEAAFEDPLEVISESDPAFLEDEDFNTEGAPFDSEDGPFDSEENPAETTYDEVLLRELVRDILREELAGVLGEKITRNVRKLVRAEISQALAARDLD